MTEKGVDYLAEKLEVTALYLPAHCGCCFFLSSLQYFKQIHVIALYVCLIFLTEILFS